MKFSEAFRLMKQGEKLKLPSWGGYWVWDSEKETVMMHCRPQDADEGQGPIIDIRDTVRVDYTLRNIASEEWVLADETNTTILGGKPTFDFGEAIKYVKRGLKLRRLGWNGKNQYIELAQYISYINAESAKINCSHIAIDNKAIAFVGTSGVQIGWLASQADMLAEDWTFFDIEDWTFSSMEV